MRQQSGAGASVSSGASYQARVGGYVLAASICCIDSELAAAETVATLAFETRESVDDININLRDGNTVYVQAKAKMEFSIGDGGELRSVFRQFEQQHSRRAQATDRFVLVTTGRSSKKVVYDVRAALDAFRGPETAFFRDQPKALTDIISALRGLISELQRAAGRPVESSTID